MNEFNQRDILNEEVDMRAYINELVDDIRKDLEVYEIVKSLNVTVGEVKENIAKFTDFKEDYNYCKKCPGIDKCSKNNPHLKMSVKKDGSYIHLEYEPCSKIMEKIKLEAKYLYKDFPAEWKGSTLKTIDMSQTRKPVIVEFGKILKGNSNRWLYLMGNHRIGKSFLLVTFANEFVAMGLGQVAVINAADKFKKISDIAYTYQEGFSKEIVQLSKIPLLVIDDFGQEYKNEFIRDQVVIPILSERLKNNLPTFFTSEFSIKEIQQLYSIGKNGGDIRGKQLAKILTEMCEEEFDLTGASIYKK